MTHVRSIPFRCVPIVLLCAVPAVAQNLVVQQSGLVTKVGLEGGQPFRGTEAQVTDPRLIKIPDSTVLLALWNERDAAGDVFPWYAITLDGRTFPRVRRTSYDLRLRYAQFDPLKQVATVDSTLSADASNRVYIVQFVTQPLEEFHSAIGDLGGKVHGFLPNHAHIVEMDGATKTQVRALPYVRWVGPLHPAYRLEGFLRENLDRAEELLPLQHYNILVFERGSSQKAIVAERIEALGGTPGPVTAEGFLLQATLTPQQLLSVVHMNEVSFVDRWTPPKANMDNARDIGGARVIEGAAGYTGRRVRGEVWTIT